MSAPADVYTPWREEKASLEARHVGREELLSAIASTIDAFIEGRSPTHIYLFAPRGLGKSHLIKLAWEHAKAALDAAAVPCVLVPEDIPELGSAEAVLARVASSQQGARWMHWQAGQRPQVHGPMVVFFEGLDRQLDKLDEGERRKLRALLEDRGPFLLVATGVSLVDGLTGRETAFYGAFSPWPVPPLTEDEAGELMNRLAGEATASDAWLVRRQTLIKLAGGSPRTLVALGRACACAPEAWASDQLYSVVQQFTADYQMRFRDLSAQQQQIVECLAQAPRELTPTELGEMLGFGPSHASGQARRLTEAGVLLSRQDGRYAWYQLSEPLFRFWLEYRNAPWEQTRIGLLGRLLEVVLTPPDLASVWMENPDQELQGVVEQILASSPVRRSLVWAALSTDFATAVQAADLPRVEKIVSQGLRSPPPVPLLVQMVSRVRADQIGVRRALGPLLKKQHMEVVSVAWSFEEALFAGDPVRETFSLLVQRAATQATARVIQRVVWDHVRDIVVRTLDLVERRGQPWRLQSEECMQLARTPVLRAHFMLQGKRATHRSVLSPDDLLIAGLGNADIDWDLLLNAALQRKHSGLFGVLLRVAETSELSMVPFCAVPGATPPAPAEALGRWLSGTLAKQPSAWVSALSWAASWSDLSAERWSELLVQLADGARRRPRQALPASLLRRISVALTALGRSALPRLVSLAEALPMDGALASTFERAVAISSQLAEGRTARLYPELAELERALENLRR